MSAEPVPLSELERDLPAPVAGWAAELAGRGVVVGLDDLGRPSITRADARVLFNEHREQQAAAARKRAEVERLAIERDRAFRASLPAGLPAASIPEGVSGGLLMMLSDPMGRESRRESVVQHALENSGSIIFHSVEGTSEAHVVGGES